MLVVTSFNSEFQEVTISGYGLGEDWYPNWGWARIFRKIFPHPHHPIPNAKFPPITALLNRPTYHKRSKVSPPPFP